MKHRHILGLCSLLFCVVFPHTAPAPLIFTPGVGWTYESPGQEGTWQQTQAGEQLQTTLDAYNEGDYDLATKSAKRTLKEWPFSDFAAESQFMLGMSYEARNKDETAFEAYQTLIERYPNSERYEEALQRQFEIANRFLAGQRFRIFWGTVPFLPDYDRTAELYEEIVKNGPYSDIGPEAQMNIGAAWEKKKEYTDAVRAYERAADRYFDQKVVAADAIYKAGLAYYRQARTAEYDQSIANDAIQTFRDFITLFPDDPRREEAEALIVAMREEQARGSFEIARFYEKKSKWDGALIYYNEAALQDPDSEIAGRAREKIVSIQQQRARE